LVSGFGLSPFGLYSLTAYGLQLTAGIYFGLWAFAFGLFFCIRLQLMACSLRPVFSLGFLLSAFGLYWLEAFGFRLAAFGLQLTAYSLRPAATSACHIY
jgi:hypothetical protein